MEAVCASRRQVYLAEAIWKSEPLLLLEPSLPLFADLASNWFCSWVPMASESGDGNCDAWAARDPSGVLSPYKFNRRWSRLSVLVKDPAPFLLLWILSLSPCSARLHGTSVYVCRMDRLVSMRLYVHNVWVSVCFVPIFKCGTSSAGISARHMSK